MVHSFTRTTEGTAARCGVLQLIDQAASPGTPDRALPALRRGQPYSCVNTTRWKSPPRTEQSRHMTLPDGCARSMS